MDITASVADLRKEIERRAKAGTVDVVMQDDYVLDDSDTCIDAIEKTTEVVVSLAANGTPEKAPSNMKVDDLRKELKLRGIEDKGVKAVLVKRLEECIAQFTPVQPPRDPVAPPAQTPLGATHSIEGLNLSYRLQSIFASAKPLTFTTKNSLKDVRAAILVAAGGVDGASDVALFSSDGVEITGDASTDVAPLSETDPEGIIRGTVQAVVFTNALELPESELFQPVVKQTAKGMACFLSALHVLSHHWRKSAVHFLAHFAHLAPSPPVLAALLQLNRNSKLSRAQMALLSQTCFELFTQLLAADTQNDQIFENTQELFAMMSQPPPENSKPTIKQRTLGLTCELSHSRLVDAVVVLASRRGAPHTAGGAVPTAPDEKRMVVSRAELLQQLPSGGRPSTVWKFDELSITPADEHVCAMLRLTSHSQPGDVELVTIEQKKALEESDAHGGASKLTLSWYRDALTTELGSYTRKVPFLRTVPTLSLRNSAHMQVSTHKHQSATHCLP
jgi:hypothetical protein